MKNNINKTVPKNIITIVLVKTSLRKHHKKVFFNFMYIYSEISRFELIENAKTIKTIKRIFRVCF